MTPTHDLIVVGAGPAGLCAAWHGEAAGLRTICIDAASVPGGAWSQMPPTTRCLSPRRYDRLPDGTTPPGTTARATAAEVAAGLQRFAKGLAEVSLGVRARGVTRGSDGFRIETSAGKLVASRLIVATGEYSRPRRPMLPGRYGGRVLHSSERHREPPLPPGHVVVVGAGNSGAEAAVALSREGHHVTLSAARRPSDPGPAPGPTIEHLRWLLSAVPIRHLPARGGCTESTPVVDRDLFEAVRSGEIQVVPRVVAWDPTGVRVASGQLVPCDAVVLATGFYRATDWMGTLVTRDVLGRPVEHGGLSPEVAGLGFVGLPCMRTRRSGFLRGFADDAAAVVRRLR